MSRIIDQTAKWAEDLRDGVYTSKVADQPQGANITQAYPRAGLTTPSAQDELMRAKMQFLAQAAPQGSAMTPFGLVTASDADLAWLQSKRDTEAEANLDAWIGANFHTNDVVKRKFLQEIYPQYYEKRERAMVNKTKMALRIHLILMRGPKNEKDLLLMWALQTGQIKLDRDWNVIGPSAVAVDKDKEQKRFQEGLLAYPRYYTDDQRKANASGAVSGGYTTWNPFQAPNNAADAGQGQRPYPFSGPEVKNPQYPTFLSGVIQNAMYPQPAAPNAPAPNAGGVV